MAKIDPRLQALIDKVTGKRPRTVIDHILQHGYITNEELKDKYGYNHPPRAIRDVRENGVPIVTERVKDSTGRSIARYKFGDPSEIENHKLGGRVTFSKELSEALYEQQGGRCALSGIAFERRYLQVDHRIPYEVAGENGRVADESDPDAFMLVSGAANRQKSWTCEHCPNWLGPKRVEVCERCYWASPEDYDHAAMRHLRTVSITWEGEAVGEYDRLKAAAAALGKSLPDYIRERLSGQ